MRAFRLLLIAAGVLALLLALAAAVAFSSGFQTWAVRRALAAQPEWRATTIESVSAGFNRAAIKGVRHERPGMVLTIPELAADLPVFSAVYRDQVFLSRLVAKGWTLDLSDAPQAKAASAGSAANAPTPATAATRAAAAAFDGVFGHLRLPIDVAAEKVDLAGQVILPAGRGRVAVTIRGGGLGAGRDGKFDVVAEATLADSKVSAVQVRGEVVTTMDTPRTFTQLAAKLEAAARGTQFPAGVKLSGGVTAARAATGETYSAMLVTEERQLVALRADFPRNAMRLEGGWKLDLRDTDVAPFALGQPLPAFTAVGEGKFDASAAFTAVRASGRLNATAGRLEVLQPSLAAMGAVKIVAEFDLAQRGNMIGVQHLQATLSAAQPVATITALQSFDFNPRTGEVRAVDAARELVGVALQGLPLAWAQPFLPDIALTGSDVLGELVLTARSGGMAVRSRVPLAIDRVSVARGGKPLLREVDLSFSATADYAPQGWQAEVSGLTAKTAGVGLATLDAKAGKLAAKGQPLKATGTLGLNLAAALQQPGATSAVTLTAGVGAAEFIVSLGEKTELQAKVALKDLVAPLAEKPIPLPAISGDLRADLSPDGQVAFNLPLLLEHEGRRSDVLLAGTLGPEKDKSRPLEAKITSANLVLDDARLLAALVPDDARDATTKPATAPWAGLHGEVGLQLKKVVYSETFEVTNVAGRLRLEAGVVKLETVQMGVGEAGRAAFSGTLSFDPAAPQPYGLLADVAVREFDPGLLLRSASPRQPATVEGKFDITSKLHARAARLAELATRAAGTFQLTSKGGVFRGLPVTAGNVGDSTSTIASLLTSASNMIYGLRGKKELPSDISTRSQAVSELAKNVSTIAYDQLSASFARDEDQNVALKDFSLIAPEVRLSGTGSVTHRPGGGVLEDAMAMEINLRGRGRVGDLLKYLGLTDAQRDDLGYAVCTVPLAISGTLASVNAGEASRRLVAAAFEKAGFMDKAADWLVKQRNGK